MEQGRHGSILHADALNSKTALTLEAKTRYLPYVAIGVGLSGAEWAQSWIDARSNQGLKFEEFSLPVFLIASKIGLTTL